MIFDILLFGINFKNKSVNNEAIKIVYFLSINVVIIIFQSDCGNVVCSIVMNKDYSKPYCLINNYFTMYNDATLHLSKGF